MRNRTIRIFKSFQATIVSTIRKISQDTDIPKSSVHRAVKKIEKRNSYPESHLWETEEGQLWLQRLVIATIFTFSVKGGIGTKTLSEFFRMINIDKHIGVSASSILREKNKMIELINKYGEDQERSCSLDDQKKIALTADETFFHDKMITVLMDARSNYIFSENFSEKRDYETWKKQAMSALKDLPVDVAYVVSDRAKALIKLAEEGLSVPSIPDLFHAARDLCKPLGRYFGLKVSSVQKNIKEKKECLEKAKSKVKKKDISQEIEALTSEEKELTTGKEEYEDIKYKVSTATHPFDIETLAPKLPEEMKKELEGVAREAKKLRDKYKITDNTKCIEKFENQIDSLSFIVNPWLNLVYDTMPSTEFDYDYGEDYYEWIVQVLLPYEYFKSVHYKNQNSNLKDVYKHTMDMAFERFQNHSHTEKYMNEDISHWSEWIVSMYQRTSSSIEGRNGYLSQIHHSGRRLSQKKLRALTTISNFFVRRFDGTTSAERLFERKFPDLFEHIVSEMDELPCPRVRERKTASDRNILNLQSVPA